MTMTNLGRHQPGMMLHSSSRIVRNYRFIHADQQDQISEKNRIRLPQRFTRD